MADDEHIEGLERRIAQLEEQVATLTSRVQQQADDWKAVMQQASAGIGTPAKI